MNPSQADYYVEPMHKFVDVNSNPDSEMTAEIHIVVSPESHAFIKIHTPDQVSADYFGELDLELTLGGAELFARTILMQLSAMRKIKREMDYC